jgi:hypothetical protein
MTGAVKTMLKHAGKVASGMLSAALVAGLGIPALGALVFLAVLVLAVTCWVISSGDRTNRVSQILLARRGDASSLTPETAAPSQPASRPRRRVLRAELWVPRRRGAAP